MMAAVARGAATATLLVALSSPAQASSGMAATPGLEAPSPEAEAIIEYCRNIADGARELRAARQAAVLKDLESQIDAKLKQLEERRAELQSWVEKQEEMKTAAEKSLVDIYAAMEADIAAEQLAGIEPRIASSVLRQMKPRQASAILNEMEPEQATPLIRIIAAASGRPKQ